MSETQLSFDLLPSDDERAWILEELAYLVGTYGPGHLVEGAIVEPTAERFPDPWTPDERGVELLARRLFGYVGLGDVAIVVTRAAPAPEGVLRLAGYAEGVCQIAVDLERLGDDPGGHLCAVAAAAYRAVKGIEGDRRAGALTSYREAWLEEGPVPPELDRKRTEIRAVYLGLGILAANHCFVDETRGAVRGARYHVVRPRRTSLSPQGFAYALAAQVALRGLGWWDRRKLVAHLSANPAGYFDAAWATLSARVEELRGKVLARPPT